MINNPIIYKFSEDLTNHRKKTNRIVVLAVEIYPTFLNTGWSLRTSNNLENKTSSDTY